MMKKILPFLLLMILISVPAQAQEGPTEGAACTTAGVMARAGGPEITSPNGGNWLICNGSNWIMAWNFGRDARSQVQFNNDTGACTAQKAGRIRYNNGANTWSFCNGIGWTTFARTGSTSTCNYWGQAAGYACPDGTVFVGFSPDSYYTPIFATRCDTGQTWNGSACSGTRTTYAWGSSGTTRSTTDQVDGRANTSTLAGFGAVAHPAAYYCQNLVANGRSDWYAPGVAEAYLLVTHQSTITTLDTTLQYQTSTESSASTFISVDISNGEISSALSKSTGYNLRCVRRD